MDTHIYFCFFKKLGLAYDAELRYEWDLHVEVGQ